MAFPNYLLKRHAYIKSDKRIPLFSSWINSESVVEYGDGVVGSLMVFLKYLLKFLVIIRSDNKRIPLVSS